MGIGKDFWKGEEEERRGPVQSAVMGNKKNDSSSQLFATTYPLSCQC